MPLEPSTSNSSGSMQGTGSNNPPVTASSSASRTTPSPVHSTTSFPSTSLILPGLYGTRASPSARRITAAGSAPAAVEEGSPCVHAMRVLALAVDVGEALSLPRARVLAAYGECYRRHGFRGEGGRDGFELAPCSGTRGYSAHPTYRCLVRFLALFDTRSHRLLGSKRSWLASAAGTERPWEINVDMPAMALTFTVSRRDTI
nr:unnamed protein product [Digitaria exilis]